MDENVRAKIARAIESAIDRDAAEAAVWGRDDCALWVANILRAGMPGDPGRDFRRKYRSRSGAYRVIGKRGIVGIVREQARRFRWRRIAEPAKAEIGDIGVLKNPDGTQTVCLKYRGRFWVARGVVGTAFLPDEKVQLAWRVA